MRGENYEGISSFAKKSNDVAFREKPVFIEGKGSLKAVFGGRGKSRPENIQDVTGPNKREKFLEKIGYHYGSAIYDLKGEDLERKNAIGTARFSEKVNDSRYKLIGENERLAKQNKKLAQDVKDLKELVRLTKWFCDSTINGEEADMTNKSSG